ncbi:hypothetical protein K469DRAFT_634795 [Zopfia rhizophila CBS 207.26]|uniref:U3 small nucleolar RNA-associated protein 10 n=1 Tax=Zopfia rhizophila CBS 207.26 TaxID=1314779 RepID=A0A6A6DVP6_9PEZI|nr:hypothetical protein K469DRAFT_634795 [Zopfia rhizophila CBS 207.26]
MTSLQKQLAVIAASSTHQLDLKAQKNAHAKSLLYDPKVAASQSFDNIYQICHEGFRDLCALDHRFLPFSRTLFSEQSKAEDRTQMTKKENEELDSVLEAFLGLISPRLLLKPAEKALEWLIRRFRIHEYNTECLIFTYLPYHTTPQFQVLLSVLPADPPAVFRFLAPYISSRASPPRQTIVYTAINSPAFFLALQSHVVKVLQAGHQASSLLSFWSSITTQAIDGILEYVHSGRKSVEDQRTEELLLRILPMLNECLKLVAIPEAVMGSYMIVTVLVTKATFEDKVLDSLMEAVVLSRQQDTLDSCLACVAIIAEERSSLTLPMPVTRSLFKIPNLSHTLNSLAGICRVERLALGCALGAVEGIGTSLRSQDRSLFLENITESNALDDSHLAIVISAALPLLRNSTPGSSQHSQIIDLLTRFTESTRHSSKVQALMQEHGTELASLGLAFQGPLEAGQADPLDTEDEGMANQEHHPLDSISSICLPDIREASFLDTRVSQCFDEAALAFVQVVISNAHTGRFLSSEALGQNEAFKSPLFLSFLVRMWCGPYPVPVRQAALRSTMALLRKPGDDVDLQILIPYLLHALADKSPAVRRSAAECTAALAKRSKGLESENIKTIWGSSNIYGKESTKLFLLNASQTTQVLSSILVPIVEECIMDANYVAASVNEMLGGSSKLKRHSGTGLKSSHRNSFIAFLLSHAAKTPLLRVRLSLLSLFQPITAACVDSLFPIVHQWCSLSNAHVAKMCENEKIHSADADREHLDLLSPRKAESVSVLQDTLYGTIARERPVLQEVAFEKLNAIWTSLKPNSRLSFAVHLLDLALNEKCPDNASEVSRTRSLETLRNVRLDTDVLAAFVESVPTASHMPEGPPATKRRRTSRSEMARVETQSPNDISRILRRLTLVLELIEGSGPEEHLSLLKSLFTTLGELQQLKQQSGSSLVYLQSTILGCLLPMVDKLKQIQQPADYQAAIRVDLLIDCIRHSTSPQVQNGTLLLIASLASWVPELVLHNLMPIFTFIGSTLLRQKDDYSAHVVDQTISRVVPQLAASLRTRNRNFLTGVADLLLSFTAAFEHIPQHRRLKLFCQLAKTLGPEDSLFAVVALLIDRYSTSPSQRKFVPELLLEFKPITILQTLKGYLELVGDAVRPKRTISDTLFGLHEKQPPQVEIALLNLLSSLVNLMNDATLRSQVDRAFRRVSEPTDPRAIFASILETAIHISKLVTGNSKLYECSRRVVANCLNLLPTVDLIRSAEILLTNPDDQVRVAAIKSVEVRAGTLSQNNTASVSAVLGFLPTIEELLRQSKQIEVRLTAVSCIDLIVERFGKKDPHAVVAVARTVSGPQSLSSDDDRLRILSLLCLTSVVHVVEDEFISLLPSVLPIAFRYLKESIATRGKSDLHNAVYTLLCAIVGQLAFMFSGEYMDQALMLSHRSAAAHIGQEGDESRRQFYQVAAKNLGAHEVFNAIKITWSGAVQQGYQAVYEQLELLLLTIENQTKSKMVKASSTLFAFLLEAFDIRSVADQSASGNHLEAAELDRLEDAVTEAVIAMTLKLNDATFRPFFVQLVEWISSTSKKSVSRATTFYKFLAEFFDKFKSIVTSYGGYIVEHASQTLEQLSNADDESELRHAILHSLAKGFQHDQDGFWHAPSHFGTVIKPLLKQLTIESATEVVEDVIPAITELAAASSSSIENHREMNVILLKYMRVEEAHTRLATVRCEQSLTKRLGEEWLGLLAEMLPFISELREDDDELVERETQKWINMMEEILGEDLDAMLQ